ncbi:hypothetical protein KSP40_PGU005942 [Platanthera guangdongensis]|uniref:Uncharacterized protein n=1 Tax=Platanthera guangdongensis TaxID=2320717 RepID=A0ABR2LKE6_9ASPA
MFACFARVAIVRRSLFHCSASNAAARVILSQTRERPKLCHGRDHITLARSQVLLPHTRRFDKRRSPFCTPLLQEAPPHIHLCESILRSKTSGSPPPSAHIPFQPQLPPGYQLKVASSILTFQVRNPSFHLSYNNGWNYKTHRSIPCGKNSGSSLLRRLIRGRIPLGRIVAAVDQGVGSGDGLLRQLIRGNHRGCLTVDQGPRTLGLEEALSAETRRPWTATSAVLGHGAIIRRWRVVPGEAAAGVLGHEAIV